MAASLMPMMVENQTNNNICPVCASPRIVLFMEGIFDSHETNVMECLDCGSQFLEPFMSSQEEDEYYNGYYSKQETRHFNKMRLSDLQEESVKHYEQYRSIYLELISDAKTILEIGSGAGGFLRFAKNNLPKIEITAVERCKDNLVFLRECCGKKVVVTHELDELRGHKFDCVAAFGVFEHIRNSRDFLINMKSFLSPRGKLALRVPNKKNALVYAYGLDEFKKFSYMKQHYYTFTEQSFERLASDTGFVVGGFNYMQVWGLDNHLSWLRYRRPRNFSDISGIISQKTLDSYNQDLIDRKMTDVVMAVLVSTDY